MKAMALGKWRLSSDTALTLVAVALFTLPALIFRIAPLAADVLAPAAVVVLVVVGFLRWPVRFFAVFAVLELFIDTFATFAGSSVKTADEIVIPLMALITLVRQRRQVVARLDLLRDGSVALVLISGVASSIVQAVPLSIWVPAFGLLVKIIAAFYVVYFLRIESSDVRWITRLVLAIGVAVLLLGAVQLIAPEIVSGIAGAFSRTRGGVPVVSSLFYHPVLFGWFCAFTGLFLFAQYAVLRQRWALPLALLFTAGTILSGRRRAILGLAGGMIAGFAIELIQASRPMTVIRRWMPTGVSVVLLTLAFLPVISGLYSLAVRDYVDPLTGAQQGEPSGGAPPSEVEQENTTPARFALYSGSVRLAIEDFPLGEGLGRYGSWMSRVSYSPTYYELGFDEIPGLSPTHRGYINDTFWPQILGETGVIGLAAYLLFLGWIGLRLCRLLAADLSPPQRAIVLGSILVFGQTLVESLAAPVLASPSQAYLLMLSFAGPLAWAQADGPLPAQLEPRRC